LPALGPVAQNYVGVNTVWLGIAVSIVFSASFWVLWGGVFYLVFFWRNTAKSEA
jgi:hypothetical protein